MTRRPTIWCADCGKARAHVVAVAEAWGDPYEGVVCCDWARTEFNLRVRPFMAGVGSLKNRRGKNNP